MVKIKKITIIGTGLIGGSLGLLIKKRLPRVTVVGLDRPRVLKEALHRKAIDQMAENFKDAVAGADLVFIATPIKTVVDVFNKMAPDLDKKTIVVDTASTKKQIVDRIRGMGQKGRQFIGGHPLAGLEISGLSSARADIFLRAVFVLTPASSTQKDMVTRAEKLLKSLGFQILILAPGRHDEAVAVISHLPYLMAVTLSEMTVSAPEKKLLLRLAAGGWKSATRVAASPPDWGLDICRTNRSSLLKAARRFGEALNKNLQLIKLQKSARLRKLFLKARLIRSKVNG